MSPNTPLPPTDVPDPAITRHEFEKLLGLAVATYHATPQKELEDSTALPTRLGSAVAEERFRLYLRQLHAAFGRDGTEDDVGDAA